MDRYPSRNQIIKNFLPERSVALISGSSGAGKTRLTMQCVEQWFKNLTFMDFSAKPDPTIVYYSYDRTEEDVYDTLNDMSLYFPELKIRCGFTGTESTYPAKSIYEKSDCVIIDGIDFLVDNPNDPKQVRDAIRHLMALQVGTSCATIGITGTNKAKIGEGYANSRDRMIGSSAWARISGTGINIVYDEGAMINSRTVVITPRNGPVIKKEMDFNKAGRLLEVEVSYDDTVTRFFKFLPDLFSTGEAINIGIQGLNVSDITVKRHLNTLLSDGRLTKIEHGRYRKSHIN